MGGPVWTVSTQALIGVRGVGAVPGGETVGGAAGGWW